MQTLENFWYKKSLLSYLLLPFAFIYKSIIVLRRYLYKIHIFKTHKFPVPVIVVGNISIGGTGKTPLVIWLADYFKQQGWRPGIVSRGYGGNCKAYPFIVAKNSNPQEVGDEALLLARNTHCPIAIAPNRSSAVRMLLNSFNCNLILSDDGLQHYALERTFEIAVVDGDRMFGNGFLLPAGPLREEIKRLQKVDLIIIHGGISAVIDCLHTTLSIGYMQLIPKAVCNLKNTNLIQAITLWYGKKVHAVAAIGNPQRFFAMLQNLGLEIIPHIFTDHHRFVAKDLMFNDDLPVLMTEKDAVKCENFAQEKFWYVTVKAKLSLENAHLTFR